MDTTDSHECTVCFSEKSETAYHIHGDIVCLLCVTESIIPLFESALQFEHCYPVSWGSADVHPDQFLDLLPAGFKDAWERREWERTTPVTQRLYCPNRLDAEPGLEEGNRLALSASVIEDLDGVPTIECTNFIGKRATSGGRIVSCQQCHGRLCTRGCGEIQPGRRHICPGPSILTEGLVLGKDIQLCPDPSCRIPVTLFDACNHVVCPYYHCDPRFQVGFCYICGEPVHHDSAHWQVGNPCPKFNQPGAANALYDRQPEQRRPFVIDVDTEACLMRRAIEVPHDAARIHAVLQKFLSGGELAALAPRIRNTLINLRRVMLWALWNALTRGVDPRLYFRLLTLADPIYQSLSQRLGDRGTKEQLM